MSRQWRFEITAEGQEDLKCLDTHPRKRVLEKLKWLTENFDHLTPFPLGIPWKGFFKLRVGDWRVVYEVENENNLVTVHVIDRRDTVYKRRKN